MNKYNIYNFILCVVLMSTIFGCSEEKSIYETGDKVITMVEKGESNEIEIVVDPARQNKVELQAQIDQISAYGIVVGVETNNSLVDEYNQKHQTNFLALPPSSYTIDVAEFIFPKYTSLSSHVNISLTSGEMQNEMTYLLPIQMAAVSGDENASINTTNDVIYLIVSKLPPPKLIHLQDVELTTEIGPGKKNWFSAYATNSEGGHTFSVEEAAEQSHMMDFALVRHGSNIRLHPSIVGWQHGGDYQRYTWPYTIGFEKLTMIANMNRLFSTQLFDEIHSAEDIIPKIEELKVTSGYNFPVADRMTSHNLQSQITGDNRVLIQGWGPKIGQNNHYSFINIKEVTPTTGGNYKVTFDIKFTEIDARTEAANTNGQNVVIDNPGYDPSNEMVEYKGVELTTEISPGKKNWFSAYASTEMVAFTQEEARSKSNMMDFAPVVHSTDEVRLYSAIIGHSHADYKERISPYVNGFQRLTYTMIGGRRTGSADETTPEHYDSVTDVNSMTQLILDYWPTYAYPIANRMNSDKLIKDYVGVIAWGHKIGINNKFGLFIVRDIQPTTDGNYKVVLDVKVPKSNARISNNGSMVSNPDF